MAKGIITLSLCLEVPPFWFIELERRFKIEGYPPPNGV